MNKSVRQEKIRELVDSSRIHTQEELVKKLNEAGVKATQATVSRDIKELRLEKKNTGTGTVYSLPQEHRVDQEKYIRVLNDGFLKIDKACNLVVIKTVSGMAMAVAAALDALRFEEVVGTIAGDDTIMCATRSDSDAQNMIDLIKKLISEL